MTPQNKTEGAAQPSPRELIAMVGYSVRCFWFGLCIAAPLLLLPIGLGLAAQSTKGQRDIFLGLLAFVPLGSLPLSLLAAWNRKEARASAKGHWNPAKLHLLWGEILSSVGVLFSLLTIGFIAMAMMGLLMTGVGAQD
jgi:hypothetical protein